MRFGIFIAMWFLSISFCNRQAWLRLPSLLYTKWAKSKIYVTEHSDLLKISYLQLYDATIWLNDKQILPCFRSCVYNRSNKNSKQREEVSSILNEVIRTISRQFISFLQKKFESKRCPKTQNKQLSPSYKFLCAQKMLLCLVFAYFCLAS